MQIAHAIITNQSNKGHLFITSWCTAVLYISIIDHLLFRVLYSIGRTTAALLTVIHQSE